VTSVIDETGYSSSVAAISLAIVVTLAYYCMKIPLGYDESIYLGISDHISRHGLPYRIDFLSSQPFLNNPPLVFYVASLPRMLDDSYVVARVFHLLVFGLPCVVGLCLVARRIAGGRGVLVALLFLACSHWFLESLVQVRVDTPVATTYVLCLYVTIRCAWPTGRAIWPWGVTAGLLTCAAALINYQAVLIPGALLTASMLFAPRGQRRILFISMVTGGVLGTLIWNGLLAAMDTSLTTAVDTNVASHRFGLSPLTVYRNEFIRGGILNLSLVFFIAAVAVTKIVLGKRSVLSGYSGPITLVLSASVLFVIGSGLLALVTVPPNGRYLLKCQPALILIALPLLGLHTAKLSRIGGMELVVMAIALIGSGITMPVSGASRRLGAMLIGLGGVTAGVVQQRSKRVVGAMILIAAGLSFTQYPRASQGQIIDGISMDKMAADLAAAHWIDAHVGSESPLAVLSHPAQVFYRRNVEVLQRPGRNAASALAILKEVETIAVGKDELRAALATEDSIVTAIRAHLSEDFVVAGEGPEFVIFARKR
jgi:4-amino-4-deoxy-L-arabinose transferase-like glycosyltransferase